MTDIRDVAKMAGVSVSTVSYAFSGKRPISATTYQRIMDAVKNWDTHLMQVHVCYVQSINT